jgi:hypothetical protein
MCEAFMVRHWQDKSRQCPACNQVHHFVYVTEPGPEVAYYFECPITKQTSDIKASDAAIESTVPPGDEGGLVVAAVARPAGALPVNEATGTDALETTGADEPVPAAPPANTNIQIERFPDGLTVNIPPAGVRGTMGLFAFAVIWDSAMAVFTVFMLSAFFSGKNKGDEIWIMLLLISLFWLVGVGLLIGSLNMARRRAAIAVTGGSLMVIQTGIFGSKQRTWDHGDVEAVRVGPSGMTVNDKPVMQLQIIDGGGDKFGMLTGRTNEELKWLAAELRAALGVLSHAV